MTRREYACAIGVCREWRNDCTFRCFFESHTPVWAAWDRRRPWAFGLMRSSRKRNRVAPAGTLRAFSCACTGAQCLRDKLRDNSPIPARPSHPFPSGRSVSPLAAAGSNPALSASASAAESAHRSRRSARAPQRCQRDPCRARHVDRSTQRHTSRLANCIRIAGGREYTRTQPAWGWLATGHSRKSDVVLSTPTAFCRGRCFADRRTLLVCTTARGVRTASGGRNSRAAFSTGVGFAGTGRRRGGWSAYAHHQHQSERLWRWIRSTGRAGSNHRVLMPRRDEFHSPITCSKLRSAFDSSTADASKKIAAFSERSERRREEDHIGHGVRAADVGNDNSSRGPRLRNFHIRAP